MIKTLVKKRMRTNRLVKEIKDNRWETYWVLERKKDPTIQHVPIHRL